VALRACEEGVRVELRDGLRDVYPLVAGDARSFRGAAGRTFSLLALQDAVVSVAGARYELAREALPFGVGRGVSNVAQGARVAVRVHAGRLVVVFEHVVFEHGLG
jgi:thiamine pyrophosphokinase